MNISGLDLIIDGFPLIALFTGGKVIFQVILVFVGILFIRALFDGSFKSNKDENTSTKNSSDNFGVWRSFYNGDGNNHSKPGYHRDDRYGPGDKDQKSKNRMVVNKKAPKKKRKKRHLWKRVLFAIKLLRHKLRYRTCRNFRRVAKHLVRRITFYRYNARCRTLSVGYYMLHCVYHIQALSRMAHSKAIEVRRRWHKIIHLFNSITHLILARLVKYYMFLRRRMDIKMSNIRCLLLFYLAKLYTAYGKPNNSANLHSAVFGNITGCTIVRLLN